MSGGSTKEISKVITEVTLSVNYVAAEEIKEIDSALGICLEMFQLK